MKKFLSILLASVFCISLSTACGGNGEKSKGTDEQGTQKEESETLENGTELEVWCWDPNFNIPAMETAEEYYKKDNPDFSLKITEIAYDAIVQKLAAAVAGGQEDTLPDIMLTADVNLQKNLTIYSDLWKDLTDSDIDFSEFADYKVKAGTVDGKIYSVPFDSGASIALYRIDMLEKAGLSLDDLTDLTWDEYIDTVEPALADLGVPMLVDRSDGMQMFNVMLSSAGTWYFDDENNLTLKDNEALRTVMETYKKLYDAKILTRASDSEAYYGTFGNGSAVGTMNACWILSSVQKNEDTSGKWSITNIPKFGNIDNAANAGNNGGSSWVVLDNENSDVAIDFLNKTFAGSVDFYNEILADTTAVSTWKPAEEGSNYNAPIPFFNDQPIYKMILEFSTEVPRLNYGLFTSEAGDAMKTALNDYLNGASLDAVLTKAEENVSFLMHSAGY